MLKVVALFIIYTYCLCESMFIHFADAVARGSAFGPGTGPILLQDVACFGNESRLVDCYYITNDDCTHSDDVGVTCNRTRK